MQLNNLQIELTDSELCRALAESLYANYSGIGENLGTILQEADYRFVDDIEMTKDESGGSHWVISFSLLDPE